MTGIDRYRDKMGVVLALNLLSVIEESGATQIEAVSALEAAKVLLPSLPLRPATGPEEPEDEPRS